MFSFLKVTVFLIQLQTNWVIFTWLGTNTSEIRAREITSLEKTRHAEHLFSREVILANSRVLLLHSIRDSLMIGPYGDSIKQPADPTFQKLYFHWTLITCSRALVNTGCFIKFSQQVVKKIYRQS